MRFKELNPANMKESPFTMLADNWMLVTAGEEGNFNMLTASWGGFGVLWSKNVSYTVVRPTRYTFEFMEKYDRYTLSFFEPEYKDTLMLCGSKSGREINKMKDTGLTPVFDGGSVYFSEARLVMVCKKLYWQDMNPDNFLDASIMDNYPKKDFHRMYVGEVESIHEKWVINPLDLQ
jgi:flavin reductase (DIM6/NTAB) family NADH-FMN oxidoreductase RutF